MQQLDLPTLEAILGASILARPEGVAVPSLCGVASHTAHVRPGDAFVALAGANGHGIDHAEAALAAGAALIISDRPHPRALLVRDAGAALARLGQYARSQRRGPVIGITGSVGKTTTKTLLGAALDAFTSPGNINTPNALAGVLIEAWLHHDPDRPLVIELGIDRRGEMAQLLALVTPTHGVLTAIAEAHLAGIGTLADVAHEKGLLLDHATRARYAAATAWPHLRDDQRARSQRVAYGDELASGVRLTYDPSAHRISLTSGAASVHLTPPGPGAPYADAALLALRVALDLGVDAAEAARRIAAARPEAHRLQAHHLGALTLIDDAYNANPTSMAAALAVLAASPAPHAVVVGDMRELGSRSVAAHHQLGLDLNARSLERAWFVGPESLVAYQVADAVASRRHFTDTDAALAHRHELPTRGSLLIKGSRSLGLERLVAALIADHAGASATVSSGADA